MAQDIISENSSFYLGINKGEHHSSVCLIDPSISNNDPADSIQLWLKERLTRKKNAGGLPWNILARLNENYFGSQQVAILENCFGHSPFHTEKLWDENFPYFDLLKTRKLQRFSSHFNSQIKFLTHHEAHAWAALAQSPYEKSLILVLDGVGQDHDAFNKNHSEKINFPCAEKLEFPQSRFAESLSLYVQDKASLTCVDKIWQRFVTAENVYDEEGYDKEDFSTGLGHFYSIAAKYIFNSFHDSGKVMGLASFGHNTLLVNNALTFWANQDWQKKFSGNNKVDWQNSEHNFHWANLAATTQHYFERELLLYLNKIKKIYPHVENLIITGGCALNCVANQKVLTSGIFSNVYIPPFPSDEGISFGLAQFSLLNKHPNYWQVTPLEKQKIYLGPKSSIPNDNKNNSLFSDFHKKYFSNSQELVEFAAQNLSQGKIMAWFQGRSETGPRALGNRSILANPKILNLKNKLNDNIKFRESFRPYGATVIQEDVSKYFQVPYDFKSPFMSFTPTVRIEYRELLKEIIHNDNTSRIQSLSPQQNPLFYLLLKEFEKLTGLGVLLNTSLNIMGEPIVETAEDAKNFFLKVKVDILVIGNLVIFPN